jgi:hypothetical protein
MNEGGGIVMLRGKKGERREVFIYLIGKRFHSCRTEESDWHDWFIKLQMSRVDASISGWLWLIIWLPPRSSSSLGSMMMQKRGMGKGMTFLIQAVEVHFETL